MRKWTCFFSIYLLFASISYIDSQYEDYSYFDPAIVNGWPAAQNQFPFMVSVQYWEMHTCGGVIISPKRVCTAGHCILHTGKNIFTEEDIVSQYTLYVGSVNLDYGGYTVYLEAIIRHENYKFPRYDIACLVTKYPLEYSISVQPIGFNNLTTTPNTLLTTIGWDSGVNKNLQSTILMSMSRETCSSILNIPLYPTIFCGRSNDNSGLCQGDSGGPIFDYKTLKGLACFIYGGCGNANPQGFTEIAYFYDWLQNMIASDYVVSSTSAPVTTRQAVITPAIPTTTNSTMKTPTTRTKTTTKKQAKTTKRNAMTTTKKPIGTTKRSKNK